MLLASCRFSMRVTIRQKDLEITSALETYINEKIVASVEKFLKRGASEDLPLLDIEVGRTTFHHKKGQVYRVSATLTLAHKVIRAEAEDEEIHAACDKIEEELTREITSFKTRSFSLFKRAARQMKDQLRFNPLYHAKRAAGFFRRGKRK